MIALWMIYAVVVTTVLALGAAALDVAAKSVVRERRWIWVLAIGLSAAVPIWTVAGSRAGGGPAPRLIGRAPESSERANGAAGGLSEDVLSGLISQAKQESLGRLDGVLMTVWAATALLTIAGYAAASWSLARRRRSWRATQVDGQAVLLAPATGPAVIGALRPRIVVPEWSLDLAAEQRALMLDHERQHVRARDPLVLHAAALVALLMPWNVVTWWLSRRLRLAVELDCDARVLAAGSDRRAYGTLLLDVCARHLSSGPVLAPALFERSSSLTRRILAMSSKRPRFARARLALGVATAFAVVAVACDVPSPEALAPDGKNEATKRLYGQLQAVAEQRAAALQATVARYFPSVARGEGGPSILFLVRSAAGDIVTTEAQPAKSVMRTAERSAAKVPETERDVGAVRERVASQARERVPFKVVTPQLRKSALANPMKEPNAFAFTAPARSGGWVPTGVNSIRPEDINSIDVSKHAPGTVAPNAVSLITITLKPGAVLPKIREP